MNPQINIGFVGAGYWGDKLLPQFLASPRASVRVVCDLHEGNRRRIESKFPQVTTVASIDDLTFDPEIDAIVLVTPPATHYALGKKALTAGKHLWIEKPLALCMTEGRELVGLAHERQTVLFVDHTFLYDRAVTMIRELIHRGDLGEIHHIYLQRLNLGRIKRDSNVWWNAAPHDASLVLHLLPGQPISVNLHGYCYLQPHLEDMNMAIIEMSDGASAFVYHSWLSPENTARLTLIGSKRFVVYEGKFNKRAVTVYEHEIDIQQPDMLGDAELPTTIPAKIISEQSLDGFQNQEPLGAAVEDFLSSIANRTEPLSNGDFSLRVLAILEAGERSLRALGKRILVES